METHGKPLQIVSTGDQDGNEFVLEEQNIERILSKIPPNTKVAVLSVVGAFRSGKSFLLTFFLRYLQHGSPEDISDSWMTSNGLSLEEGNMNGGGPSLESENLLTEDKCHGFAWSGGQERQTTGIWMWSEPFFRKVSTYPEDIAILVMDTQGMFDNETSMSLTARIFGLSTLISSYQIYNVDKRIQEDNLQHLALFSEYGRLALGEDECVDKVAGEVVEGAGGVLNTEEEKSSTASRKNDPVGMSSKTCKARKPFQRMEFLVRDWQNFDRDWEESVKEGACEESLFKEYHHEMMRYFTTVIKDRGIDDLQSTRDQIAKSFDKVGCFLLPHPGFAVVKKNYKGEIDKIEPSFRGLLNHYVRMIFDVTLEPKMIANRFITAKELLTFVKSYSLMFQDGDSTFPKAMTMLEATADANNRNAFDMAFQEYKRKMDTVAGPQSNFIKESHLNAIHGDVFNSAMKIFDGVAGIGSELAIKRTRDKLLSDIENERRRYFDANMNRNPFKNVEFYALPLLLASVSWVIAVIIDSSCSTDFCENAEDGFQNIYLFVFFGFIFVAWRHIAGSWDYLKSVIPVILNAKIGNLKQGHSD